MKNNNTIVPLAEGKQIAARFIWLLIAAVNIFLFIIAIPIEYGVELRAAVTSYGPHLPRLNLSPEFYAITQTGLDVLLAAAFIIIGVIIFFYRPGDGILILISLTYMTFGTLFVSTLHTLGNAEPFFYPIVSFIRAVGLGLSVIGGFYLIPNGRFVPPVTRYLAILWTLLVIGWLFIPALPANLIHLTTWSENLGLAFTIYGSFYFSGVLAQIYRYKKVSTPIQRQQTKWVVLGASGAVLGFVLFHIPLILYPSLDQPGYGHLLYIFTAKPVYHALVLLAPVSVLFSIMRYRLWDVDRLINRSLVYGILTVVLAALYFGLVIFLRTALLGFTEHNSVLSVIVSTLAMAALFHPLRGAIQKWIDMRFFRRKYDTEKTLEAFRHNLRHLVDLNQLTGELIRLVDGTVQPEHVSLWLKGTVRSPEDVFRAPWETPSADSDAGSMDGSRASLLPASESFPAESP